MKVVCLPARPDDILELLLGAIFELWYTVYVSNLVHLDVEKHWRSTAMLAATAVIVKSIHELDNCLNCTRVIFLELYGIFSGFLTVRSQLSGIANQNTSECLRGFSLPSNFH